MNGRALFVVRVKLGSRRFVGELAERWGMQPSASSVEELLLLAGTSDPAELGKLAQRLAALEGVQGVECSVELPHSGTPRA